MKNASGQKLRAVLNADNSLTFDWDKISGASKYILYYEKDGKDVLTVHAVRYSDKYVKLDGRWWIAEREQHFEWTSVPALA